MRETSTWRDGRGEKMEMRDRRADGGEKRMLREKSDDRVLIGPLATSSEV